MGRERWLVALRAGAVLGVIAEATRLVWGVVHEPVRVAATSVAPGKQGLDDLPFESALLALCGTVALLAWCWLALTSAAVVVHSACSSRRRPGLERLCPGAARRIALAACGLALGSTIAAPATADSTGPPGPVHDSGGARLAGLSLPDRVTGLRSAGARGATVQVATGDSLWAIAERSLPADASDYEITVAWHALYRANAELIGGDPDLILPGTRLRPPRRPTPLTCIDERTSREHTR